MHIHTYIFIPCKHRWACTLCMWVHISTCVMGWGLEFSLLLLCNDTWMTTTESQGESGYSLGGGKLALLSTGEYTKQWVPENQHRALSRHEDFWGLILGFGLWNRENEVVLRCSTLWSILSRPTQQTMSESSVIVACWTVGHATLLVLFTTSVWVSTTCQKEERIEREGKKGCASKS